MAVHLNPPVHDERWNPCSFDQIRKRGVVVHTAESSDGACQALIDLMHRPGDRISATGGPNYGASYHAVTTNDPNDIPYAEVQGPEHGPFAAPPLNYTWYHICMPGRADQGALGWDDVASRAGIRGVARFIVDKAKIDGFPLVRCSVADLLAGDGGYCGHVDVSNAWHKSDHTDPGPTFPWNMLAAEIAALTRSAPVPLPVPLNEEDTLRVSVMIIDNSSPAAIFLGLADAEGHFWEVHWVDGGDPAEVRMLQNQLQFAKAPTFHFQSGVCQSLKLTTSKLPSGLVDGRSWAKSDFGNASNVR